MHNDTWIDQNNKVTKYMKKPIIIANWKMNKNVDQAVDFLNQISDQLPSGDAELFGIAPQAFAIYPMLQMTKDSPLQIIGQNAATKYDGAYTGEISVRDLAEMGVNYVMLGHSERRRIFKETNSTINEKVLAAVHTGVTPIVCTNEEQEPVVIDGQVHYTFRQLRNVLHGVPTNQVKDIILSFEPSGSIGYGHHADLDLAERGCREIRQEVARNFGEVIAQQVRILYGGSVNPTNISTIMSQADIDGVLIGRASLDPDQFIQMLNFQKSPAKRPVALGQASSI